jgi:phosphoenolpyruvate phosphomutase
MNKAKLFRKYLKEKKLIRLVGAHNGLTAKLVEEAGFEGIWASGLEISTSYALPDANILTMTEFLEAAIQMNEASSLPVIADCDTGFGNSNNVIHLVKKYENSGIAGICIEDKVFPKVNSLFEGRQELAPIYEFVGKIMAAKNARKSKEFLIFARVEALVAGWGHQEALKRATAYAEVGVDGILIHSKSESPDEIIKFIKDWRLNTPLIIVPTKYPSLTEKEMIKYGIKITIYANHGMRGAIKAIRTTFREISRCGIRNIDEKVAPLSDVFQLQGLFDLKRKEEEFLKGKYDDYSVIIPAAGIPTLDRKLGRIFKDIPVSLIDINGKTLLRRNIMTLNKVGLKNLYVVAGYKKELFNGENCKIIENDHYQDKNILYSVLKAQDKFCKNTIVIYSDIIFHGDIIRQVVDEQTADVLLVMDSTCKLVKQRNKNLEVVVTKEKKNIKKRNFNYLYSVVDVGSEIDDKIADGEFAGIVKFSKRASKELKKINKNAKRYKGINIDNALLSNLIRLFIDMKYTVKALDVNSGWTEVHTLEKYKHVCSTIK